MEIEEEEENEGQIRKMNVDTYLDGVGNLLFQSVKVHFYFFFCETKSDQKKKQKEKNKERRRRE